MLKMRDSSRKQKASKANPHAIAVSAGLENHACHHSARCLSQN